MSLTLETEPHAHRLRIWYGLFAFAGGLGELVLFGRIVTPWHWVQYLVAATAFLALAIGVPRQSRPLTWVAYGILNASGMAALWINNQQLAATGVTFQTFTGFKLMAIVGALILPADLVIAIPSLVVGAVLPAIEWATWPAEWRAHSILSEPLGTVFIGLFAIVLYAHRVRGQVLQRRLYDSESKRVIIQEVARIALAMKDLSNTPLQTLTAGLAVLRGRDGATEQVDRLQRAVSQLSELNHLLEPYLSKVDWSPDDLTIASRELIATTVGKPN
jgi:hypothetical protein